MANSVDPEQTAPRGAVCSGSTLFASILYSSVMLCNYLQQTTSADENFKMHFFLGALRVDSSVMLGKYLQQSTSADVIFQMHFFLGALWVRPFPVPVDQ